MQWVIDRYYDSHSASVHGLAVPVYATDRIIIL